MCVVAIGGIVASVALPAFAKYVRQAKTTEASLILRNIYDAEISHFYRLSAGKIGRGSSALQVFTLNQSASCGNYTTGPLCYAFTYSTAYDSATGSAPRGKKTKLTFYPAAGVGFDISPYDWYKSFHTLGVNLDSPSYFAYYVNLGAPDVASLCFNPARYTYYTFRAEAYGDLDGDGVQSTFSRMGYVDRNGEAGGTSGVYSFQSLE